MARHKNQTIQQSVQISNYPNVRNQAASLGCAIPTAIAILPRNFDTAASAGELLFESNTPTVRILWRTNGIVETPIDQKDVSIHEISEHSFESWLGPTIFIGYSVLSQNPALIDLSLGVLANYLTDIFRGVLPERSVKLDIVVEKKSGECSKLHYDGQVSGLKELPKIIREVSRDKQRGR